MSVSKTVPGVVVSADEEFRRVVGRAASAHGVEIKVELTVNPDGVSPKRLKEISLCRPRVIVIDLGSDPGLGCRLAQHLYESHPMARIVVAAAEQTPELLKAAMRAGATEFLEKPVSEAAVEEALSIVERRLGAVGEGGPSTPGRIYGLFSAKGGAGSTTVATNLAIQLQRLKNGRTIIVDMDIELGEVAIFLGLEPRFSIVDLVANLHRLDDGLLGTFLTPHASGIDVLAAPYQPRQAEGISRDQVRRALRFLRDRYDHVVVDVSNSINSVSLAALEEADELLLVTQVDVPSLRNVQRCRDLFDETRRARPPIRVVVNRYQPKAEISLKDVEESLDAEVYWTLSNDYDSVVYSINTGKPLVLNVPCACSREIEGLVRKIEGIAAAEEVERRGLLARLTDRLKPRKRPSRQPVHAPAPARSTAARRSSVVAGAEGR